MERLTLHPGFGKNTQLGVRQPGLKSKLCHTIKVTKQSHFCISSLPIKEWGRGLPRGLVVKTPHF